jgi:hypothetical protein
MKDRILKFRRQRWISQVIANGERLRELEIARAGIDATLWPLDAASLDDDIERRIRRRDSLLTHLKETDPV